MPIQLGQRIRLEYYKKRNFSNKAVCGINRGALKLYEPQG